MNDMKNNLLCAIYRSRIVTAQIPTNSDLRMSEILALEIVRNHNSNNDWSTLISEISDTLCVTHPAVSQILGSLEDKGYLNRYKSKPDRRLVKFTLTENGQKVFCETKNEINMIMNNIISCFGEERAIMFIQMVNDFTDSWKESQNKMGAI